MRAATEPGGFYRSTGAPGRGFRTAAGSQVFAAAVLDLALRVDDELGRPRPFHFVDVGAGDGRLLAGVREGLPERRRPRWRWSVVELAGPPPGLAPEVSWLATPPSGVTGLIVANEWLDTVPVEVVVDQGGARKLRVDASGQEMLAERPSPADLDWLARFWPLSPGARSEVGLERDRSWRWLVSTLAAGAAVAIDYPARPSWCPAGTLTGYRGGRQVPPRPTGDTDLTAGVVFAALVGAGRRRDGDALLVSQRRALELLGGPVERRREGATDLLAQLSLAGERTELRRRDGFGAFRWLVQTGGGIAARPLLGAE